MYQYNFQNNNPYKFNRNINLCGVFSSIAVSLFFFCHLLLNDDYTPMEFVVIVLQRFFHLSSEKAVQIMLNVHTRGSGVCGVYTAEIAETKIRQVLNFATENEHPLQCTMEPD